MTNEKRLPHVPDVEQNKSETPTVDGICVGTVSPGRSFSTTKALGKAMTYDEDDSPEHDVDIPQAVCLPDAETLARRQYWEEHGDEDELTDAQRDVLTAFYRVAETQYSYVHIEDVYDEVDYERLDFEELVGVLIYKGYLEFLIDDGDEVFVLTDDALDEL